MKQALGIVVAYELRNETLDGYTLGLELGVNFETVKNVIHALSPEDHAQDRSAALDADPRFELIDPKTLRPLHQGVVEQFNENQAMTPGGRVARSAPMNAVLQPASDHAEIERCRDVIDNLGQMKKQALGIIIHHGLHEAPLNEALLAEKMTTSDRKVSAKTTRDLIASLRGEKLLDEKTLRPAHQGVVDQFQALEAVA
ncbi:MAG: hypothetical protein ABW032_02880 [Burkholderiaceae bacterium]